ncbi:hypothetical protein JCGZ_25314 [Jatropha curcas]|uniref:Uncharacterized protein n=1 Tax=Jatropha curcas TaxID=180498 RepID=A0A067JXU6_JATCU|nr:hypothetical protein JCGZ_25314 [Jatropha curcas]
MLKVAWEKLCTLRYADFIYRMRKSGKNQQCESQKIRESWSKAWEDPAFKRKCEIFAQNRRSETGASDALAASSQPQLDHSVEEISAFRACVDAQERQLAKLRAHVMRMSALHQPLSSPFDPDTADNTLVTPVDTTTHLADTPVDTTILDRAEDRHHPFNFGPF